MQSDPPGSLQTAATNPSRPNPAEETDPSYGHAACLYRSAHAVFETTQEHDDFIQHYQLVFMLF
jgi:hypothetical protein